MKRAIGQIAICVCLFVLVIASTANAFINPLISNCTTISQPGSYVLTNNIIATPSNVIPVPGAAAVGATACIVITADFVTLDLAGFAITASNLGATLARGISTNGALAGPRFGIYVHSGSIGNFSEDGVLLLGEGHTVEHIRAVNNAGNGIAVGGGVGGSVEGHRIVANVAISNGGGISVNCPAVVLENVASGNGAGVPGQDIIENVNGSTSLGCTSQENSPGP